MSSRCHCYSNVWNSEDSNVCSTKLLFFFFKKNYTSRHLEEIFKIFFFPWQSIKEIKIVKLGTFVWDKGWIGIML